MPSPEPSPIRIRLATADDTTTLVEFNRGIARETEGRELDLTTVTHGVSRFLSQDDYGFYTVAELDGTLAGSLMITYEWSDWRNGVIWWIQSVYVKAEFRRRGIYAALYGNARQLAAERGDVCAFRLYVEKDNTVAQQTYRKLGMAETHYRVYEADSP